MRSRSTVLAAAVMTAALTAGARAATLAVTITGLAESEYELDVSGIQKSGRLGGNPGAATVRSLIQVEGRDAVTAKLTFTAPGGATAACSAVKVKLTGAQAACEPAFVLTDRQIGSASFVCESRCDPRKTAPKATTEDEDDQEWIYARKGGRAAPRLDGWASHQSFYSNSMLADTRAGLY